MVKPLVSGPFLPLLSGMRMAGWVAAVLVVAGCGGSPQAGSDKQTGAPTPPPATSSAPARSARQVNSQVVSAVREAGSGQFSQRVTHVVADGNVFTVMSGRFNLADQSWEAAQKFESDSATVNAQEPDLAKLRVIFRVAEDNAYMTMPEWPAKLRGRWLGFETGGETAGVPVDAGSLSANAPQSVSALLAMKPASVEPNSSGWTLSGQIPVPIAMAVLGMNSALRKKKIDITALKGTAEMTVEVSRDGHPVSARIEGRTVSTDGSTLLPQDIQNALDTEWADITFSKFGDPVSIDIPAAAELIDTSEMNA